MTEKMAKQKELHKFTVHAQFNGKLCHFYNPARISKCRKRRWISSDPKRFTFALTFIRINGSAVCTHTFLGMSLLQTSEHYSDYYYRFLRTIVHQLFHSYDSEKR